MDSPSESDSSDGSPEENEQNKKLDGTLDRQRANEKKQRGHRTFCKKKLFTRDRHDRLVFACNSHRQLNFYKVRLLGFQ